MQNLHPEAPSLPSITGYTKGVVQPAEPEPTIGVPSALPLTKGMPLPATSWKGPQPQAPVVPQGYPSKPAVPEQAPVVPQNKVYKPAQYIPQEQAPIPELSPYTSQGKGPRLAAQPTPEIPQGIPQKRVAPALLPFSEQEKPPKQINQVPQLVAPVYPQGNGPRLGGDQLEGKGPKPTFPAFPQAKGPKPVAPEPAAPQSGGSQLALEPTPQMKGPKVANPGKSL